jgi:hypothetical protein
MAKTRIRTNGGELIQRACFLIFSEFFFSMIKGSQSKWISIVRRSEYALLCQTIYRFHKHLKKIRARKRIPPLPFDLWNYIAQNSTFEIRKLILSLSSQTRLIQLRLPFPHVCYLCKKEPFIPVKLRFEWKYNVFWNKFGFCKHSPFFCLRCARAWVRVGLAKSCLICTNGCCKIQVQSFHNRFCVLRTPETNEFIKFDLYMGYGDWPRLGSDICHIEQYKHLDKRGIGNLQCNICNEIFHDHTSAVLHIRNECRSSTDEYARLHGLVQEIVSASINH